VATRPIKDAIWLQRFFKDIGFLQDGPMTIYNKNQSFISFSKNPTFNVQREHVEIHHHFILEKIKDRKLTRFFAQLRIWS